MAPQPPPPSAPPPCPLAGSAPKAKTTVPSAPPPPLRRTQSAQKKLAMGRTVPPDSVAASEAVRWSNEDVVVTPWTRAASTVVASDRRHTTVQPLRCPGERRRKTASASTSSRPMGTDMTWAGSSTSRTTGAWRGPRPARLLTRALAWRQMRFLDRVWDRSAHFTRFRKSPKRLVRRAQVCQLQEDQPQGGQALDIEEPHPQQPHLSLGDLAAAAKVDAKEHH